MGFSSGAFSRLYDWTTDRDAGTKILAERMDNEMDGMADALSQCILKDGTQTVTANIPFNGFKLTGVGDPTAAQDVATKAYVDGSTTSKDITVDDASNNAVTEILELIHTTSGTPAAGIGSRLSFTAETADGNNELGVAVDAIATDVTSTAEVFNLLVNIMTAGSLTAAFRFLPTEFRPETDDGAALGSGSYKWADAFLASGAVINFNNGDVTITHAANQLSFAAATAGYHFDTSVMQAEQASAIADVAGKGQWWTINGTPNRPNFTDDSGQDFELIAFSREIPLSDETTALEAGTSKATHRLPFGAYIEGVRATVTTAPTGAVITVDINEDATTILSTKLTIDATEKDSATAATAAVISDASIAAGAELTFDIDGVGSTVAGAGLKVTIWGYLLSPVGTLS